MKGAKDPIMRYFFGFPDSSHAGSSFGESMIIRYPKPYPEGRSEPEPPQKDAETGSRLEKTLQRKSMLLIP